jgi:hypothetical protein|tara:strand:- start:259 stop:531 length:273 start_codon:yes stop_codon:yes gene_type:complete
MKKATLGVCILSLIAWTWVLWLYIRYGLVHPIDLTPLILQDLEWLGPFAILLDLIILLAFLLVINPLLPNKGEKDADASEHEPLDNKTNN